MAIHGIQGLMGAGKSCVAVNRFLADFLLNSQRHIYTNLPLRWVGETKHGEVVDGVNTRTSEPADMLELVAGLTKNLARRQAMMARIHFLKAGERVPLDEHGQPLRYQPLDEDGNPEPDAEPVEVGPKHGVREFWYFTQPNCVVFLDEVADIWSTDDRKSRPDTMKSYVRHHRHYKDDLFFFFQDKEDIDPDLRRKLQYLWTVRNSTKENMWDHWAFRGLKWPLQFFFVKCYLGRSVVGLAEEAMKRREPQESWLFWPTRRSFRTYWSFSQAGTLPGKKAASESAQSTDFDPSLWGKVKGFVNNLGPVLAVAGGILGLAFGWWYGIHALMKAGSGKTNVQRIARNQTSQTNAPAGTYVTDAGTGDFLVTRTNVVPVDPERIILVTPALLRTTKRDYGKGDELAGGRVARFLLNGVELEGGNQLRFDVLFPGGSGTTGPGGGRHSEPLRGQRTGPRNGQRPQGQRSTNLPLVGRSP